LIGTEKRKKLFDVAQRRACLCIKLEKRRGEDKIRKRFQTAGQKGPSISILKGKNGKSLSDSERGGEVGVNYAEEDPTLGQSKVCIGVHPVCDAKTPERGGRTLF